MEFKLKRQPETKPDEGFWYVHRTDTEEVVGRIYDDSRTLPPGSVNIWHWTISFPYYRGSDEIWYGNVPTIEEAIRPDGARFCGEYDPVLVWDGDNITVAHRSAHGSWFVHDTHGFCEDGKIEKPTHWMPLPAPPG